MIYFVTENYIKNETPISKNVDVQYVAPWIKPACETRIVPLIGRYFYSDLLTKYNNQSLSANELELVKQLQPCIAWRAASMAVYGTSRPLKNIGLQKLNAENSDGVDLNEVTFGMEQYDRIGSDYQKTLSDYLLKNKALFSKFTDPQNSDSSLYKKSSIEDINDNSAMNDSIMFF